MILDIFACFLLSAIMAMWSIFQSAFDIPSQVIILFLNFGEKILDAPF